MTRTITLLIGAAVALAGCGQQGEVRQQIRAVGSSTVYPFSTAVAEQFTTRNPGMRSPIVESTGSGAGISLFCAGVGAQHPDIANASRRMRATELQLCNRNGVAEVIELQIGVDGLALVESVSGPAIRLTTADIYRALAANPFGEAQNARTWQDVNPALPAIPIQVYGPPSTSGTRDSLAELIMTPGCDTDPRMQALRESNEDQHATICTRVREDGAYIEAGENDNLIVQRLANNPNAIGVLGYSFLEENQARVRGVAINNVDPNYETISTFAYPGARPLYIYVKSAHLNAIPGLREFVSEYAGAWNPGGYLARRGLIPAPDDVRARNAQIASGFTPLAADALN